MLSDSELLDDHSPSLNIVSMKKMFYVIAFGLASFSSAMAQTMEMDSQNCADVSTVQISPEFCGFAPHIDHKCVKRNNQKRFDGFKTSSILTLAVRDTENRFQVNCQAGKFRTGLLDGFLTSEDIYTATCTGDRKITLKVKATNKMLNQTVIEYRLKSVSVKLK